MAVVPSSTGYAVNYHQIRNVQVTTEIDPGISKKIKNIPAVGEETDWEDEVETLAGNQVEYKLGLYNNGPDNVTADFPVALADGLGGLPLTNLSWCATASSSGHFRTGGTSGTWQDATTRPANYCDDSANWTPGELPEDFVWYANSEGTQSDPAYQVDVRIKGSVTNAASGKKWVNTATITPDKRGPQDSNPNNNYDSAAFNAQEAPRWTVAKKADPSSGEVVSADEVVTYTVTGEVAPNTESPVMDSQTVYVKVDKIGTGPTWDKAYMNYAKGSCTASSGWTPLPGQEMTASTDFPGYWELEVTGTGPICATFTDGNGAWLNNNGGNIQITAGAGYSTVTQTGTTNMATVVGENPSGEKWDDVNTSSNYPPVSQPVITDDLSGVLGGSPALASYVGTGVSSVVAKVDGSPVYPTEVVDPSSGNGWHLTVTLGNTTVKPGQNVTVEYQVKMSSDLPGGEKIHNIATGNAANGAPSQCATGAVGQADYEAGENEACWTEHPTQAQTLTLIKEVVNPDGLLAGQYLAPGDWTLSATTTGTDPKAVINEAPEAKVDEDDTSVLATKTVKVSPGEYVLDESPTSATSEPSPAAAYKPDDAWTCTYPETENGDTTQIPATVTKENKVTVPAGKDVTCVITNSTAELTVLKQVKGDKFKASDFELTAKAPTSLPGLPGLSGVAGSETAGSGNSVLVYPEEEYELSEKATNNNLAYLQQKVEQY